MDVLSDQAPGETASNSSATVQTSKTNNRSFFKRYAKPLLFVLAFAIIGGVAWGVSAATTTYSLWDDSAVPKKITADDPKSAELGVRFHATADGYITGIRFYKGAQNTGTHVGNLWDSKGHLLARVTFTGETSNGWQTAKFGNPVSITANTTYVASYFAPKGHYSANNFYFSNSARTNQKLVAPKSGGKNPNGVYAYSGSTTFPTDTYQATNYWVDVLYSTKLIAPAPTPPSVPDGVTASANGTSVSLTWSASAGQSPIAHYNVYRDGTKIITTGNNLEYTDASRTAGQTYKYQVQAIDSTGSTSALSPAVSVTIPQATGGGTGNPTPPPVGTPTPPSGNWPTAQTTGATGTLTNVTGDVTLDTPGQVYQNMKVDGSITVLACNVTIKNVEVDSGVPFTGDSTPDVFAIWLKQDESCNVNLDHVSVITKPAPNAYVTTGVRNAYGGSITMTNSKITGVQIGVVGVGGGTFQGNYMLLGPTMRGDHNEDIEVDGSTNLTFKHNTFLNPNEQTAALALFTEYGSNQNMVVQDNLLAGGGYTCYCGDGKSDNNGNPARSVNVSFVSNVFWKLYYPNVGFYGEGRAYNPAGGGQWVGNIYMNADGTLTNQAVSQPSIDQ